MSAHTARPLRPVLSAVTVFGLATLALGAREAFQQASLQRWSETGLDWLALEHWRSNPPLLVAGAVGLVLGAVLMLAEKVASQAGVWRGLRACATGLGSPIASVVALALAFGLPTALAGMKRPAPAEGAPNVLYVLVDTWRADHVGFLGYERDVSPKLDELVKSGVVFERTQAPTGWTKPSVATAMTGLIPSKHCAVSQPLPYTPVRGGLLPPFVTTFVETFRGHGWDTAMWSNNPNITPPRGFDQGAGYFRDYFHDPQKSETFDPGRSERMLPDVERWLENERDPSRPFCAYVHIMDPHYPYVAPAPFKGTFDRSGLDYQLAGPMIREYMSGARSRDEVTPEKHQRILDIYDEELLYVDHHLGDFLKGVLERHPNTIVVLSGDHGEEFMEHGNWGHGHAIWQELVHVPLVIWGPGVEPGRVEAQVRLMDVYPTLLELAGIPEAAPKDVQGKSLVPMAEGTETEDRWAPMETGGDQKPAWQWRAVSDGRYKFLLREPNLKTLRPVPPLTEDEDSESFPQVYLFDLQTDPTEQVNLFETRPDFAESLGKGLFDTMKEEGWYVAPKDLLKMPLQHVKVSAEHAHVLDALGYGGGGNEEGTPGP